MTRMIVSLWVGLLLVGQGIAAKPNVVVLLADDLGWQDIGCYGGPVKTPNLDTLAEGGVRFTDFYSGCAVCSPSRAVLLTGRHHIRAGVYSWIHDASQNSHLLEREVTLAEVLKGAGYATAHVGKWHLGLPTKERKKPTPDAHGFDHWFATWNNAEPSHKNPRNFIRNGEPVGPMEGYSCQLVADEAIGWLEGRKDDDAPFFLNVWFHEPHAPIAAPDGIVGEYGALKDKAAVYSGTIDNTDRAIGRLLAKLDSLGVRENTLVVYASDNGSYRDDRTGGLRGRKGMKWEGGIGVPGIFSWPGVIGAKREVSEPAGLVDLLPTVCGLVGLEAPAGVHLDGSDLSGILKGEGGGGFERHQPLFWHLQKARPMVAMRDGAYSLVAEPDYAMSTSNMFKEAWIPTIKSGGYTNFQLFDLEADPAQTKDLAAERPEVLAGLKKKLLAINASVMADGADWHLGDQAAATAGSASGGLNTLTAAEKAAGWKLLFEGKSLDGWRRYGQPGVAEDGWEIVDGLLHKPADKRVGDLMTEAVFEDFEFVWEWRLLEGGNNGVKYMITQERQATVGHEYQMIDDAKVKDGYSSTGSFYLVVKPREDKGLKPMGEWNRSRLVVKGNHVEHWLNGKKLLEYECGGEAVMGRVPETKFKKYPGFGEKVVGHLLLTDHKDPCWFRNLKVREL